jgi:phosphoribosylaminoimidazole-succinocarboxamide synthase
VSPAPPARDLGVSEVVVPGVEPWRRGKVRSVYALDGTLLLVATDRLSAYDSILPTPIPDKGRVLTALSAHWFRTLASAAPHHLISTDVAALPEPFRSVPALAGRTMVCERARRVDVECVVRGHLTGSGLREVRARGTLHGEPMAKDTPDGARLDPPRFTPTTKAEEGHDQPLTKAELAALVGADLARDLERRSVALYEEARARAWDAGLVLADTKFEFGFVGDTLTLIDELLSPDSSRYWDRAAYERGELVSFDKQYVRDWLDRSGWDHAPPAPALPEDVVAATRERYLEAAQRLIGPGALA